MANSSKIHKLLSSTKRGLAVLIDPDHSASAHLKKLLRLTEKHGVDFLLVGGSLLSNNDFHTCVRFIKKNSRKPLIIFPGNNKQIDDKADAIFLLSMISSRNPEYLIGQHVAAAAALKKSGLEIIPTAYLLIGDNNTTAAYMSGGPVIPYNKNEIAAITALAGEQLGMKIAYLDAGSGAQQPITREMIRSVKKSISIPLVVGGGIRSANDLQNAWNAGANLVVIGSLLEENPDALSNL